MPLLCLGLSHKTAPVQIRERVAFAPKDVAAAAREIAALPGLSEAVVLSTCNRMEIYTSLTGAPSHQAAEKIIGWLRHHFELGKIDEDAVFFRHAGEEAARHLFSVASGLDSMVLGETEVFGQVKDAYASAHAAGATARLLNKLFQEAFRVGKIVRNSTEIQRGSTSIGSVAVDLAEKIFGDLKDSRVMLLGAGEISRRTAQSLQSRGARSIIVSNRSHDRAVELAAEMDGRALHFDDWPSEVNNVDIVISSTSAPHTLITPEHVVPAMRHRRGRPLFFIDIAVPRDIDPAVNALENVYLFDIDALEQIASQGRQRRELELQKCREIVDHHVRHSSVFQGSEPPVNSPKPDPGERPASSHSPS